MTRSLIVMISALLLAVATACSSGGDSESPSQPNGDSPTTSQSTPNTDSSNTPAPSSSGGEGTLEINGQSFGVQEVLRCTVAADRPDDLNLIALADGVQMFVVFHSAGSSGQELSIQGANAGGVFAASASKLNDAWYNDDGDPVDGPAFTVNGDQVSGAMTLKDSFGTTATADVSFNISIPSSDQDC